MRHPLPMFAARIALVMAFAAAVATAASASASGAPPARSSPVPTVAATLATAPTIAAAGDIIGNCTGASCGYQQTATVIKSLNPTGVLALGDISNRSGSASDYTNLFNSSWGAFKARIHPVPGNHDYGSAGAANYFNYFGAAAHPPRGYYSLDLGTWHIIAINSNCSQVGGCQAGSTQEKWLKADLAQHPAACTLAIWHHPRYSSGYGGDNTSMKAISRTSTTPAPTSCSVGTPTTTSGSHRRTTPASSTPPTVSDSSWWAPAEASSPASARSSRTARCATTTRSACCA